MLRVLHLHSSFHAGGKELRAAQLINAFGAGVEHVIVSAIPSALGAADAIDAAIPVSYPDDFPALAGKPLPGRLRRIAGSMQGFDLVLTYNWGAMDAVMAHRLFARAMRLPPLVHHEDGFNQDEAQRLKPARNWYRSLALRRASALVVPSQRLEAIARDIWHQSPARVQRIANGIDTAAYGGAASPGDVPGLVKQPGDLWLGTLAGLRPVKNLPRMVRAFAGLPDAWQLVIFGQGPEAGTIRAEAERLGVGHRLHLPGFAPEPARAIGQIDLFALSSDSEQFPISLVEAMAAGLAVAAPQVGDVAAMVPEGSRAFITPAGDEAAFAGAVATLAADPALRARLGKENQAHARRFYDEKTMVDAYSAVYGRALGRARFP